MKRVLITGVAGFIGAHVADHCIAEGFEVVGVDNLSGGFIRNVPDKVAFVKGDVENPQIVTDLWEEHGPFDYVYHLAAYAAEGLSHFIRRYNYRNNLIASVNLINESVKNEVKCFVFTSSIAVYGTNQLPMHEDVQPKPEDPYGIAKYAVEMDLMAAHDMFGLEYIVFRPHNVYGPRQNIADKYRNVIGIFMNQVMQGKPMTIFGDGRQTRAFSYIDDVAPIIAKAPQVEAARNKVFNIGADEPCTILELADEVARAFGVEKKVIHLPPRNEVVHALANHRRLREVFGDYRPISLRQGIQRMADWVRARGPAVPVTFDAIELYKDLPPSWESSELAEAK